MYKKCSRNNLWCRGYYVDTVGRNKAAITKYIQNQIQEDHIAEQISMKEYIDPFTGELENRVSIQEDTPNIQADYQVIDKVKFIDSNNIFMNEDIVFNEDLNTIIGGKSSGKSLLLSHIARTINGIDKNVNITDIKEKIYNFDRSIFNDKKINLKRVKERVVK